MEGTADVPPTGNIVSREMAAHNRPGRVVQYVKHHRHAVEDGEISELASGASQCIHTATLHDEGEAVASGERPLMNAHSESSGEISDTNPLIVAEPPCLTGDNVR